LVSEEDITIHLSITQRLDPELQDLISKETDPMMSTMLSPNSDYSLFKTDLEFLNSSEILINWEVVSLLKHKQELDWTWLKLHWVKMNLIWFVKLIKAKKWDNSDGKISAIALMKFSLKNILKRILMLDLITLELNHSMDVLPQMLMMTQLLRLSESTSVNALSEKDSMLNHSSKTTIDSTISLFHHKSSRLFWLFWRFQLLMNK
jgi:hypothetical protein